MRIGRERKAQERLQKRQRVRETGSERKGHRETKRKRKRERESKKERWRESDRFGERIAAVGEKGHRDREDERFDGEIARMRAVIERRRHRESREHMAPQCHAPTLLKPAPQNEYFWITLAAKESKEKGKA